MEISISPVTLERRAVRLEPLGPEHLDGIAAAATDGELWNLWFTGVPRPEEVPDWFAAAMAQQEEGNQLAWAVRDLESDRIVGSTRYHDVVAPIGRVEIGYTWYAKSVQRTHVNSTCKLLLLEHAFESLGCAVVGLRTDGFNHASQRAIAALGAQRDGVLRHHSARRDGSARDTVMFSILAAEWPGVRRHLEHRLARHAGR